MSLTLPNTTLELQTTTAIVDGTGQLRGLEPLPDLKGRRVQIVIVSEKAAEYNDSDLTPKQWERGVSVLMAADFVDDPAEDIYSLEDGKPFDASEY